MKQWTEQSGSSPLNTNLVHTVRTHGMVTEVLVPGGYAAQDSVACESASGRQLL